MNKSLIICLFISGLLTLSACSTTHSNSGAASNTNNAQPTGNVNTADTGNTADNTNAANIANTANGDNVQKISDIQKTENVGKTVTVQGKVVSTMQSATFHISGYKIQDSSGTIDVSSSKQPQVNTTVTVTGNLYQSRFFGLVINETG